MSKKEKETPDEKTVSIDLESLRCIELGSLNYTIVLKSSFRGDSLEKLSSKAITLLKEVKRIDGLKE